MAENKTVATKVSVGEYVESLPDEARRAETKALVKLMGGVTGERAKIWGTSIIGFGNHHYVYDSGREGDMPVVSFAPRKAAIVFYGLSGCDGCKALLEKLGKHTRGKGCVYVKRLGDIDMKVLEKLVGQAVSASDSVGQQEDLAGEFRF